MLDGVSRSRAGLHSPRDRISYQWLAKALCELLAAQLQIAGDRVFLNFTEVPAEKWSWNGSTFG